MKDRLWKFFLFAAACLVVIAAYVFVPWTKLDSGWSQAVGSFAALGVAIYVMARQNRHAAELIVRADVLATRRRAAGVHAIVRRAHRQILLADNLTRSAIAAFVNTGDLAYELRVAHGTVAPMVTATLAIPTHELGSYEMADAVHQLGETLANLQSMLERGIAAPQGFETDPNVVDVLDVVVQRANDSEARFADALANLT